MRTMWASGAAIVVCLALAGMPVAAQSPSTTPVDVNVLFEVTVPVGALPETLEKINLERETVDPAADVSIPAANESIRGRVLYLDSGELVVTPMVDALVWRADAALRGVPTTAPAGRSVELATGDAILLPAIPPASLDPAGTIHLSNPGTVPAVTLGFHLHQMGGQFPGWPAGMSGGQLASASGSDLMATIGGGNTVYRLVRLTVPVGARLEVPRDATLVFHHVEQGRLDRSATGAGGTTRMPLSKGMSGVIATGGQVTYDLSAGGDVPAIVLELAVVPSAEPGPSPAPSPIR